MSHIPRINEAFPSIDLSHEEIKRYSRHLIMPEVTIEGQKKLKAARVLTIGTGGLGSPLLAYLAAAGVGKIGLVDFDVVDLSNLQRQIIHATDRVGQSKVKSAKERIADINPFVQVETFETALKSENALEIIRDYDIVVDGTDNFPTRYLVNDACVLLGKPNVYGSIFRFEGQASVFWAEKGPCYRCLYPEPPPPGSVPSCAEGGVLGVLPGVIGVIQAIETVKLIIGQGNLLVGRLLLFDAMKLKFREMKLRKDPSCPVCGKNPTVTKLIDYEQFCGVPAQEGAQPMTTNSAIPETTVSELKQRLDRKEKFLLLDVREPFEHKIAKISGATLLPLGELPTRYTELPTDQEIILQCKSGVRSVKALQFLRTKGFTRLFNLKGGITAWSQEIDPSIPKY